ncbi:translation initiation factor IF-3 [candidate division TA06 bacterium]|nr:translation initiation factor IF-3 [candidate division TA06 bacterium]
MYKHKLITEGSPISKDYRVNNKIRVPEVRVVGPDGQQIGVLPIAEALRQAEDKGLDLVEIVPEAKPPVCKIIDFGKFLYHEEKNKKEARKKQHEVKVKEVRLGPKIGEHDYLVKFNHAKEFLAHKDKVRVSMRFRGREMAHIDIGRRVIDRFMLEIADVAVIEQQPKLEGNTMVALLSPKSTA